MVNGGKGGAPDARPYVFKGHVFNIFIGTHVITLNGVCTCRVQQLGGDEDATPEAAKSAF